MPARPRRFRVVSSEDGMMLGAFVARRLRLATSEAGRELVRAGGVYLGKHRVRISSVRVASGERVSVYPRAADIAPLDLGDLRILHRDETFVVLDKPPGVPASPTRQTARGCLSEALIRLLEREGLARPYVGVLHPPDAAASGLVLFTVRSAADRSLHRRFERHPIRRVYRVLVHGHTAPTFSCSGPPAGTSRERRGPQPPGAGAVHFRRLWGGATDGIPACTLLEAVVDAAPAQQVAIWAADRGHAVVGAATHSDDEPSGAPLHVHAHRISFDHPLTGQPVDIRSPLPAWARVPPPP